MRDEDKGSKFSGTRVWTLSWPWLAAKEAFNSDAARVLMEAEEGRHVRLGTKAWDKARSSWGGRLRM
jgi:hypothetical protein